MNGASTVAVHTLRPRILERRARLQAAAGAISAESVNRLLAEIDATLDKIENGSYGLCETCHDPIEPDRLERDPLARFCLDHLTDEELNAHEQDIELATKIQSALLPPQNLAVADWDARYRYEPAGAVGGDYCELIPSGGGSSLFFAVGDVAGKGVAASLLMTHLSAIFRSLISLDLPLVEAVTRANRLFCDSTAAAHYATLACGRTTAEGIELCNAGHCRPLLLCGNAIRRIEATGLPLGLFCSSPFQVDRIHLRAGDSLVLYSDGITETPDPDGNEYGEEQLVRVLRANSGREAYAMAEGVVQDVTAFRGSRPPHDDMTVLVIRRQR